MLFITRFRGIYIMPSLNYDYTQSLRRQNALYVLKYSDPVKVAENPAPVIGYSGHVPSYRSSIHDQRVIRSLMRSLVSPMKPTTATGFVKAASNLPKFEHEKKEETMTSLNKRARSAPVTLSGGEQHEKTPPQSSRSIKSGQSVRVIPSKLAMMSAGGLDKMSASRPHTAGVSQKVQHTISSRASSASSVSLRPITEEKPRKHPTGFPQTLYGASYWYAWKDEETKSAVTRPESYQRDRSLNRHNNVLYHKYEGVVPKYMGYVPGYKFRHGSTYGVLTVRATEAGVVHKLKN
ncbi:uncharacterized protein LOC104266530 [Ciona intestinalis]